MNPTDQRAATIRSATLADAPAMLAIEQAATSHPWTLKLFESCFGDRYFNFVLEQQNQICGFYIGEFVAGEASLFDICIAPTAQGQGFGRLLLEHFINEADRREAFECWLEVRESNSKAITLYQKAGFHQIGKRPNYYPTATGHEDAILMGLPLRMG
ncbi:ribosomal-protein-alanine N-acetyltransferase [Rheinheimera riviphila]|uniref:[Ribosomal protein bS18]-alanine N-acetyltransferase n=1 Tax=Rheinheimera riviphila TaxID=1834037 RepID=A0A437QS97_9GAMM|nr:ribosomal protein S18-alanine N-acetyltransferase [Rheinheimera riviphila]RVU37370.1 ribosomal-protein-alanine N-acetyltransferase [Rheinheimera riviphila]